jgi:membrane protein
LFGALGVFGELQNSLNTIWEVKPKPAKNWKDGIKRFVMRRLLSFTMVLGIGFLLLASLVVSAAVSAFGEYIGSRWPMADFWLGLINFVIAFIVITFLFAMIFKFLPEIKIAWKDVWLGAAVTSALFSLGKFLIGLHLGRSEVGNTFGAAGSLAILLIWIYYSAQILFFGAEFTQVYANRYGSKIVPDPDMVKLSEIERAEKGIPHEKKLEKAGRRLENGN